MNAMVRDLSADEMELIGGGGINTDRPLDEITVTEERTARELDYRDFVERGGALDQDFYDDDKARDAAVSRGQTIASVGSDLSAAGAGVSAVAPPVGVPLVIIGTAINRLGDWIQGYNRR